MWEVHVGHQVSTRTFLHWRPLKADVSAHVSYLDRSVQIWSFDTQVDQTSYREANKQPIIKTEVVDQLEHIRHRQKQQWHGTLTREEQKKGFFFTVFVK